MRFTWLLSAAVQYFVEIVPPSLIDDDVTSEIFAGKSNEEESPKSKNTATTLRFLKKCLGSDDFRRILYASLTGIQILLRGPKSLTSDFLTCLSFLVPEVPQNIKFYAPEYLGTKTYNFIGTYLLLSNFSINLQESLPHFN